MGLIMPTLTKAVCHLCGGTLKLNSSIELNCFVTSDCQPWYGRSKWGTCLACGTVQKEMTDAWHAQVSQIYKQYDVYSQGDGAEQLSFNAETGANRARSSAIVKWLDTKTHLNSHGNVLDIGCGNGCFLKAFHAKYQDWTLAGVDLDDRYRINIESISDSSTFHSGKLEELDDKYDLIVMIHSLEHIPYPVNFLKQLKSLMKPAGLLLLEVPDLANSPFDLIIADHCTHFSVNSLTNIVQSSGFRVLQLDNNCVAKEITLIATNDINYTPPRIASQ